MSSNCHNNKQACNADETVSMKSSEEVVAVIEQDTIGAIVESTKLENSKFKSKQIKYLAGISIIIFSLLLLIGIYVGLKDFGMNNGNKSEYILGGTCMINGTNITTVVEHNLVSNNESTNFTSLLLQEYLISISEDGHGTGTVENADSSTSMGSGYEVDVGDGDRRLLQSCSTSGTSSYGGSGGGSFSLKHPSNTCLNVKSICVRSGSLIDAIYIAWTDGTVSSTAGGSGGSLSCYTSSTGCITTAFIRHGSLVDALLFVQSDGSASQYFGGSGGSSSTSNFGNCLKRIDGRSGSKIDRIKFYY